MSEFNAVKKSHAPTVNDAESRRAFLKISVGAAVAGAVGVASAEMALPARVAAQSNLTPDEALKELMEGNARFAANKMTSFEHDVEMLKSKTVDKQEPYAAVLACADSRVPVEILFDQTIGHVFVARVAGNVVTPEIIGSLEYGAAVLGTKVILVLGHRSCGAVKAAIQGKGVPGQISSLFPHLQPAVDAAGPETEATTKENAKVQARLLRESSTVISEMVKAGKVKVVPAYYDLGSGAVTLLE
ncbi:MAG: carbonic anhydrase [Candidatus Acidiferrales bacterium]